MDVACALQGRGMGMALVWHRCGMGLHVQSVGMALAWQGHGMCGNGMAGTPVPSAIDIPSAVYMPSSTETLRLGM